MHTTQSVVARLDGRAHPSTRTLENFALGLALTTNLRLAAAPGNVLLPATEVGLPRESVANVTQLVTVDRDYLLESVGQVPAHLMARIDDGLRLVAPPPAGDLHFATQ